MKSQYFSSLIKTDLVPLWYRLQEQLRRIKRNEEKDKMAPPSSMKKKKKESAILKTRVGTTYIVLLLSL